MTIRSVVRPTVSGVLLALPFVVLSLWLGGTISAFGSALVVQGVVFAACLAAASVLLSRALGRPGAGLAFALYALALVLWFAACVSWFMQGSSFNERFFVHLDVDNARVSLEAYPWAFVGVLLALAVLLGGVGILLMAAARRRLARWAVAPAVVLLVPLLLVDAPPRQLYAYLHTAEQNQQLAGSTAAGRIRAMLDLHPSRPDEVKASPGRNLVFVYMESVERSYTDTRRFPDLVPNINRLRRQGLDFSGLRTFPGVTYTIAGIFSSQCGAPFLIDSIFGNDLRKIGFVPTNNNTSEHSFHPELACLGDVLHAAGYHQTYLSGVNLGFANTDVFFKLHGYDEALGKKAINALHDDKLSTEGWGLLDEDMFAHALWTYRRQEASGKPFSVVFSTIDTHPPEGYIQPGCATYAPIRNAMLDAVHCSDQLLARFIAKLKREPGYANTLVVVMSDHVAMRNVASSLYPPDDQRQPLLFMLNAGQGDRPARMYHMDIAPTVLARLGVRSNVHFMAGADRGEPDSRGTSLPADDLAQAVLRQALWKTQPRPQLCEGGVLLHWNPDKSVGMGGWKMPFMVGGFRLDHIADRKTLVIFADPDSVGLQVLFTGTASPWLRKARKEKRSVLLARPFWDVDGRRMLALDWLAPGGAWASLGAVDNIREANLRSPRCAALLQKVSAAPAGARLDFSKAFGTMPVPATAERVPGFVKSPGLVSTASPIAHSIFMLSRVVSAGTGNKTMHITKGDRISLYPASRVKPWVEFDVSGLESLTLVPRINALSGGCLRRQDTGIVEVSVSVDGHALPKFVVDRNYAATLKVDTTGARRLRVLVGEHGIPDCDYFSMGFQDIRSNGAATAGSPPPPTAGLR